MLVRVHNTTSQPNFIMRNWSQQKKNADLIPLLHLIHKFRTENLHEQTEYFTGSSILRFNFQSWYSECRSKLNAETEYRSRSKGSATEHYVPQKKNDLTIYPCVFFSGAQRSLSISQQHPKSQNARIELHEEAIIFTMPTFPKTLIWGAVALEQRR